MSKPLSSPFVIVKNPDDDEVFAKEQRVDGSVSNIMDDSGSDPHSGSDPLERELNLTEYEIKIQAANGFEVLQRSKDRRVSEAQATDGESEIKTASLPRFKSVMSEHTGEFDLNEEPVRLRIATSEDVKRVISGTN